MLLDQRIAYNFTFSAEIVSLLATVQGRNHVRLSSVNRQSFFLQSFAAHYLHKLAFCVSQVVSKVWVGNLVFFLVVKLL